MKENVTILSIDDDPQICFALGELFKFQGWRAVSASDVASGVGKHFAAIRPISC